MWFGKVGQLGFNDKDGTGGGFDWILIIVFIHPEPGANADRMPS